MTQITQVVNYINSLKPGVPFSGKALYSFVSPDNARQILSRLVKTGELKRISRGIFLKPKTISGLGEVPASVQDIAKVVADSTGETIEVHGAEAARQLKLATQVPMKIIYQTSGTSRKLTIGGREFEFRHVSQSKLCLSGTVAGKVVAALSYLGKDEVTPAMVKTIRKNLSDQEFFEVVQHMNRMPTWIVKVFHAANLG